VPTNRKNSIRRTVLVLVLVLAGLSLNLTSARAATAVLKPAGLLQFISAGHVLGFEPGGMVAATASHALRVTFVDANAAAPQRDAAHDNATPANAAPAQAAPPLTSVVYPNLWDGVTLTYDASGGIVRSSYRLEPFADASVIRLRYNRPAVVQADGTLRIAFEDGALSESAPIAWQELDGRRMAWRSRSER
jgi:hypothetical protein